jgi:hypothetical protein
MLEFRDMSKLSWARILLAGFLAEVTVLLLLFGIRLLHGFGPLELRPLSPIGTAAFGLVLFGSPAVFASWATRNGSGQPVLDGLLVGVTAVLVYEIISFRQPKPHPVSYYLVVHALKIVGGAVGGWHAARQRRKGSSYLASTSI